MPNVDLERIYLAAPNVGVEELDQLKSVLDSGWIAPMGPAIKAFESQLALLYPGKRVLALSSGTAALHLALVLSGISDGDEVIIGSFTFAACANVVLYERAIPIFMDSEKDTWNLDPTLLREYLHHHKKPHAVIVTHLYGVPAQINEIREICNDYEILLIEDAAEALGSQFEKKSLGLFGDYGILSFNGNKIATTSGGGALILSPEDYEKGLSLATQANDAVFDYHHKEVGFNYRMSNVLAGIGIAQLSKLDKFIARKRELFAFYQANLSRDVFLFPKEPEASLCNRWLTTPLINEESDIDVLDLIRFLDEKGIESRRLWNPLHLHPAYQEAPFYGGNVNQMIYKQGICLPSGTGLKKENLVRVIECVHEYLKS